MANFTHPNPHCWNSMSTTDYTKDLDTLKTSLNQLNKEGLDLSSAMQTYQQGLKQHERCVNTLTTLEQSIESNEWTVEPVELKLEDILLKFLLKMK